MHIMLHANECAKHFCPFLFYKKNKKAGPRKKKAGKLAVSFFLVFDFACTSAPTADRHYL